MSRQVKIVSPTSKQPLSLPLSAPSINNHRKKEEELFMIACYQ
jgi:hypothetical protein